MPLMRRAFRPTIPRPREVDGSALLDGSAVSKRRLLDDVVWQLADEVRGAARLRFPRHALVGWSLGR